MKFLLILFIVASSHWVHAQQGMEEMWDKSSPLMFIKHPVAITKIAGIYSIVIRPVGQGKELFKLKTIILEPAK